ncbi:MAG: CbiX/SirB N-terminal domain-containing protein [Cyanobacteria bacterium]|nr:CbiX/SirB N-terminal domain-containing protein [Cyanobacteriota bacterium]
MTSPDINTKTAFILLAHGSRDPHWRRPFEVLLDSLQMQFGNHAVYLAYMEMAEPTLADVAVLANQAGKTQWQIFPLFMSAGGHVRHDIPPMIEALANQYPSVRIDILPPLGEHPLVHQAITQVAGHFLK